MLLNVFGKPHAIHFQVLTWKLLVESMLVPDMLTYFPLPNLVKAAKQNPNEKALVIHTCIVISVVKNTQMERKYMVSNRESSSGPRK